MQEGQKGEGRQSSGPLCGVESGDLTEHATWVEFGWGEVFPESFMASLHETFLAPSSSCRRLRCIMGKGVELEYTVETETGKILQPIYL